MAIDDYLEFDLDCESGTLRLNAWAKDRAGNAPFMSVQTDIDSGHASFTIEQAEVLAARIAEAVRLMKST